MSIIEWNGEKIEPRRIYGGFAGPGEGPGYGVVVVEAATPMAPEVYPYYLLAEVEEPDLSKLLDRCIELRGTLHVDGFYGRRDEPMVDFVQFWNREAFGQRRESFYLRDAPRVDETGLMRFHLNILKKSLDPDAKRLYLGEHSKLPERLLEVPPHKFSTARDFEYPAVAALAYAVSALTIMVPLEMYSEAEMYPEILGHDGF